MAQTDRRGFQFPMQHKHFFFLFSTLVNEYWTLHDLPTKPEFRDEYIVVLLTKIMRGGEYDVMIIDAVQTYFLFRGGNIIPC